MLWILQLLAGALLMALSANVFLVPLKLAEGGVTGIGIILYHLLGVPMWVTQVVVNIPILALGLKVKGWRLIRRSLIGVAAYSFFLAVTANVPPITDQVVLAIIYGGLTMGIGLGLVLRSGGSTGGTEVLALVLQQRSGFSVGSMVLAVDTVVLAMAAVAFSPEAAMWAVITLFISSKVVDVVQVGLYSARGVTIITTRPEPIARRIMNEVERGVTIINGTGAFTGEPRTILYTVAQRTELTQVKQIAYAEDPKAFVVVAEVHEVLGEGFRDPSKDMH
ncbi:YitT family protein [Symbiobacterium thermophilum]|uniref:YitT family protein n=1 Tax=Symbiobacterium thermophilum TaxID=2734 RepID=A0A953I1X7_SYMTR|nr:YitT family protein [Symbiobacterium thermophilum]MBY6276857.1 YitT family protein [Symbiobacterium thermophilum]